MDLRLVSTPLTQAAKLVVVPLAEMKTHLRLFNAFEDTLIQDKIEAAYDFLAGQTGWLGRCCLLEEEFEAYLSSRLSYGFELPMRPFSGLTMTDFSWVQANGSYLSIPGTDYYLTGGEEAFAKISRANAIAWPYFGIYHPHAYRIRFKAGFGTTRVSIPSGIREAIRMMAAHLYTTREATRSDPRVSEIDRETEYGLRALAGRWRLEPDHS